MAAKIPTEGKTPGAKTPNKYPTQVGANYQQWGEQPGFIYDPYTDQYYKDKKAYEEYMYSSGQAERPKGPPSLADTVLPLAAMGVTAAGAEGIGKGLSGFFGSGASTAAAEGAKAVAPKALSGLQGLGGLGSSEAVGTAANGGTLLADGTVAAPGLFSGIGPMAGSASGLAGLGLVAAGTYLGGKSGLDMLQGKSDNSLQGKVGRGLLGVATGGISEMARPFLMHKSTRDVAKDHTKDLQGVAPEDARYQAYVSGMREQYNQAPTGKAFGNYDTWDEAKAAGLQADNLTGVYGNLKAYGPQWAGLTFDQQKAVTQLNINDDLYYSKKGEVELSNEQKAKENLAKVLASGPTATPSTTPTQAPQAVERPTAGNLPTQQPGQPLAQPAPVQPEPKPGEHLWIIRNGKLVRK